MFMDANAVLKPAIWDGSESCVLIIERLFTPFDSTILEPDFDLRLC